MNLPCAGLDVVAEDTSTDRNALVDCTVVGTAAVTVDADVAGAVPVSTGCVD